MNLDLVPVKTDKTALPLFWLLGRLLFAPPLAKIADPDRNRESLMELEQGRFDPSATRRNDSLI